jgi:hypothetical protein
LIFLGVSLAQFYCMCIQLKTGDNEIRTAPQQKQPQKAVSGTQIQYLYAAFQPGEG